MKKIITIALAAAILTSCFSVNTNFKWANAIQGKGEVLVKEYNLGEFDKVELKGHADVILIPSDTCYISLKTQENIFDYVEMSINGSTLIIETKDHVNIIADDFDVTVGAPVLSGVVVKGAGDVKSAGTLNYGESFRIEVDGAGDLDLSGIKTDNFAIEINGAGDVEAKDIDVHSLSIEIHGAGDAEISGKTVDANLKVNGAGDIDARNLEITGELKKSAAGVARVRI